MDWDNKNWSYLLGVIQGDGCINKRSISITVGAKEKEYLEYLSELIQDVGYNPKVNSYRGCYRIDINSTDLTKKICCYKTQSIWSIPNNLDLGSYVAGVFDTDGCVSMPTKSGGKFIIITLKRSGNLKIIKNIFDAWGMENVKVNERMSKFGGKPYPIEEIKISSAHNIKIFNNNVHLKHEKKKERLAKMINLITERENEVPLWEKVAKFMEQNPKNSYEIMNEFNITKDQFDSAIQNIKKHFEVKTIPPEPALNKYKIIRRKEL